MFFFFCVCLVGLSDYWTSFRSFHLLSNGKERTLIADFLAISSADRDRIRSSRAAEQATRLAKWEEILAERKVQEAKDEAEGISKKNRKKANKDKAALEQQAAKTEQANEQETTKAQQ